MSNFKITTISRIHTWRAYTKFLYNAGNALAILKLMLSSRGNMDVNEAIKCIRKMK